MLFSFMLSLTFLASKHYNKYKEISSFETFLQFWKQLSFETKKKIIEANKNSLSIPLFQFLNPKILSLLFVKHLLSLSFVCKPLIYFHSHHQSPKICHLFSDLLLASLRHLPAVRVQSVITVGLWLTNLQTQLRLNLQ